MRAIQVLQLSAVLMRLCLAVPGGKTPASQLEMLNLGMARLLERVGNDVQFLERQGDMLVKELHVATKNLEGLQKKSLQASRTHKQVRKDLQIQTAGNDRLSGVIRDLQKQIENLDSEQGFMQLQMNRIIQDLRRLKGPKLRGYSKHDGSSLKVLINDQARRLINLTAEVSARDRIIDKHLRQVEHLEKRLFSGA